MCSTRKINDDGGQVYNDSLQEFNLDRDYKRNYNTFRRIEKIGWLKYLNLIKNLPNK